MRFFAVIVLTFLLNLHLTAQDNPGVANRKLFCIETKAGPVVCGQIISEDSAKVIVVTSNGQDTIPTRNIREIRESEPGATEQHPDWFENPAAMHYIVGPSGFNLRKNEFYYDALYVFGQSLHYGITDHFSAGIRTEILSTLLNLDGNQWNPPVYFSVDLKAAYPCGKNFTAGGGVSLVYNNLIGYPRFYGVGYALLTYGNKDNNLTLAVGAAGRRFENLNYQPGGNIYKIGIMHLPVISIAGQVRITRHFGFTTENWILPEYNVYSTSPNYAQYFEDYNYIAGFSLGGRLFWRKATLDLGLFNDIDRWGYLERTIGLPYLNFSYRFSK